MTSIALTISQKIVRRTLVAAFVVVALGVVGTVAASKDDAVAQVASVNIAPAARIPETGIGVQMNASFSQAARRCLIGITKQ